MTVRLHVNVDHVATLRQARGTEYPDVVEAAGICERAGAHGITIHLREDRRHIQDADVSALRGVVRTLLNLEMAATDEMVEIASRIKPDLVTLVPEKREERTTEGGLDVAGNRELVTDVVSRLNADGVPVSLFIDPDPAQVALAPAVGAIAIELHTGDYAAARGPDVRVELERLVVAAGSCPPGVRLAAGHGLTQENVPALVASVDVEELNIGHAVVADAVFVGLPAAVAGYLEAIAVGVERRPVAG